MKVIVWAKVESWWKPLEMYDQGDASLMELASKYMVPGMENKVEICGNKLGFKVVSEETDEVLTLVTLV